MEGAVSLSFSLSKSRSKAGTTQLGFALNNVARDGEQAGRLAGRQQASGADDGLAAGLAKRPSQAAAAAF